MIGTRRFDRPSFLSECFDEPEPQYFYMFKECGCPQHKLTEIQNAFSRKHHTVVNGLQVVTAFFQKLSYCNQESSRRMLLIGMPSQSFLSSCRLSMLFDLEKQVFDPQNGTIGAKNVLSRIQFCEIRSKY